MDQHQGTIVDEKGQPLLHLHNLHVSMRVSGSKWKGFIESPAPVPAEDRPVEGRYCRLRLANGQEKTIHIGTVTLIHSKNGDFFRAAFDTATAPPVPPTSPKIGG